MRYVSLFSGIEAASVAWGPLGWEPVAFSEVDPFACAVLAERFPEVPNLGDVAEVDWSDYVGSVDIVVGGSPCQAFSVAGKRRGLVDARGRLMLEYVRAVRDLRPRWLLWENVPGVLSQSRGDAFETIQRELEQCGYSLAWRTLDAQFFGVAQRRRRVFLVGRLGSGAYPAAVLFEWESLRWDSPSSKRKRQELARAAGGCAGGGCRAGEGAISVEDGCLNAWMPQHDRVFAPDSAYQTLCAHGSGGADCGCVLDTLAFDTTQMTSSTNRSNPQWDDPCHTLSAAGDPPAAVIAFSAGKSAKAGSSGAQAELAPTMRAGSSGTNQVPTICATVSTQYGGEVAGKLTASADGSPCADRGPNVVCAMTDATGSVAPPRGGWRWPWIVRRLMPVECERLQGFPDNWTRIAYRGKPASKCPDTPRYKALGNSMAVPVMQWIGRRIAMVDEVM